MKLWANQIMGECKDFDELKLSFINAPPPVSHCVPMLLNQDDLFSVYNKSPSTSLV